MKTLLITITIILSVPQISLAGTQRNAVDINNGGTLSSLESSMSEIDDFQSFIEYQANLNVATSNVINIMNELIDISIKWLRLHDVLIVLLITSDVLLWIRRSK